MWSWFKRKRAVSSSSGTEGLKNAFSKNIGKKFIAFIFALSLWFAANLEQDLERDISAGISYVNLPQDLTIINKPPETLSVRVGGPRNRLNSLSSDDIRLSLDLSEVSVGTSRFEILSEQIKSPREIQVIDTSLSEVKLEIDELVNKRVKVRPVIGIPDTGYEVIGEPGVTPSEVELAGPKSVLSGIEAVPTDLVSTAGAKSGFAIEVPLNTAPRVEVVGSDTVRVTVNVEERTVTKEFNDINIDFVNFDDLDYEPSEPLEAKLEFEGPYSIIKDLGSDDIKVFVDGSDISDDDGRKVYKLQVNVEYPSVKSVIIKKKFPETVEIKLN